MSDIRLHPHYLHFSELPYSMRALYTAALLVLGLGYLFALVYLFHSYAGRAGGNPMQLTYNDVVVAYSGSGKGSRLEAALRGPMSTMLPTDEASKLITWVETGADKARYESDIIPVVDKRCMNCHDGSNPHLPNLGGFDNIKKVTEKDTGTDIFTLVRVSHIHSFGLTFVFFLMGTMFGHAYMRPVWLKCTVIAAPYLCLVTDIGSWYFIKLYQPFAWVTMAAGGAMGACFAFMWVVSMYQMWFSRAPKPVMLRSDDKVNVG
ncbi:MAG: hypothetical protein WAO76_05485 [Georgfuchsia sp.]